MSGTSSTTPLSPVSESELPTILSSVRTSPPWLEGSPALRVGWDPTRREYIIRAPGAHIIGCTSSLETVGYLIRHESLNGFYAVEALLHPGKPLLTCHALKAQQEAARKPKIATVADLDDITKALGL